MTQHLSFKAGMFLMALLVAASAALAADLLAGQIVDRVTCALDSSQSYALYVPSGYTPSRTWPVIFAFDPGGRGRNPVERYQAAAERYGFIVAGSHDSRNGSLEIDKAVAAMTGDVMARFNVDLKRIYAAGMSGGARIALVLALNAKDIAGAIASSAGYPDGRPRKTLPFPIFATAGTEDFNHLEMRQLNRALTTPHHLAIFEGGHVWLSSDLATEAVEWMEIQAMKAGRKPRDENEIDQLLAKRTAAVGTGKADKDTFLALQAIVEDFQGLRDVSALATRAAELGRDKSIRAAIKKDEDEDDHEEAILRGIASAEARLGSDRVAALSELRQRWKQLSDLARKPDDSAERRMARRVLSALGGGGGRVSDKDPEYLTIIAQYRLSTNR